MLHFMEATVNAIDSNSEVGCPPLVIRPNDLLMGLDRDGCFCFYIMRTVPFALSKPGLAPKSTNTTFVQFSCYVQMIPSVLFRLGSALGNAWIGGKS